MNCAIHWTTGALGPVQGQLLFLSQAERFELIGLPHWSVRSMSVPDQHFHFLVRDCKARGTVTMLKLFLQGIHVSVAAMILQTDDPRRWACLHLAPAACA